MSSELKLLEKGTKQEGSENSNELARFRGVRSDT